MIEAASRPLDMIFEVPLQGDPIYEKNKAKAVISRGGGGGDLILTQEDFETIRRRQFNREVATGLGYIGEKGIVRVDADDIEGYKRKVKMDRDAKIRAAMEGRADRAKFGGKERQVKSGGLSNKEKQKSKNFLMVQNKMQKKTNGLTIHQKKMGTGFMGKMKMKGRKTQLGKKARLVQKKQKKTR